MHTVDRSLSRLAARDDLIEVEGLIAVAIGIVARVGGTRHAARWLDALGERLGCSGSPLVTPRG